MAKAIGKLVDQAATLLQKLVRLKAADDNGYCQCVTCGKFDHWKNMQGGHFIPRGNAATKLVEENINPQCKGCNGFAMKHGDAAHRYTLYMVDMYGRAEVDEMLRAKHKPFKWFRPDVEDMIKELKEQVKELEAKL